MQTGFDYVDLLLMTQGTGSRHTSPTWVNLENYDNCEGFEEDLLKASNTSCLDYLPGKLFTDQTYLKTNENQAIKEDGIQEHAASIHKKSDSIRKLTYRFIHS